MHNIFIWACAILIISCSHHSINEQARNANSANDVATSTPPSAVMSNDSLTLPKSELTKLYVQAIGDYIKAVKKDYSIQFDTLFFGKHVYGQEDDFPDIELPETIEHTQIRLVTPEFCAQKQKDDKSSYSINLIGWVDYEKADFIFVAFSNGNQHQFDYYLDYTGDKASSKFTLEKARFENFLFKRK
ncbi:MAG: hypothetical protein IT269_14130 [Saprospiraceae bacterium]|nr:hypothetical protein [Saprospiraceae bacterium]